MRPSAAPAASIRFRSVPVSKTERPVSTVVANLNPVLLGWATYFYDGNCGRKFNVIDGYAHERRVILISRRHAKAGGSGPPGTPTGMHDLKRQGLETEHQPPHQSPSLLGHVLGNKLDNPVGVSACFLRGSVTVRSNCRLNSSIVGPPGHHENAAAQMTAWVHDLFNHFTHVSALGIYRILRIKWTISSVMVCVTTPLCPRARQKLRDSLSSNGGYCTRIPI